MWDLLVFVKAGDRQRWRRCMDSENWGPALDPSFCSVPAWQVARTWSNCKTGELRNPQGFPDPRAGCT